MHTFSRLGAALTIAFGISAWSVAAHAQDPATDPTTIDPAATTPMEDASPDTPRSLALGTGGRASAVSTAAVIQNPAAMALSRLYHMEAMASFVPDLGRWAFGGTVIDSMTNRLAAGFSMRGILGNGETGYGGIDGRLALAFPLMDELAIGLSGRYLSLKQEGMNADGTENTNPLAEGFTMDASIIVAPFQWLRIAALAQNFIDLGSTLTPVLFGGSASVIVDALTIGGDVLTDISSYDDPTIVAGGGVEYLAGGVVPIRAGYRFDQGRGVHTVSGGLGYMDPKWGLEVSFRHDVHGADSTQVMLGFRYFVQ